MRFDRDGEDLLFAREPDSGAFRSHSSRALRQLPELEIGSEIEGGHSPSILQLLFRLVLNLKPL